MKVPLQQEILDVLKQKLLPEMAEIKADLAEFKVEMRSELKVINGQLNEMDKRFDQVDGRLRDLTEDVREVRSYVFTSHMSESKKYSVVREKPSD